MARLEGQNGHSPTWFSLAPIPAVNEGQDATEYLVQIWPASPDNATLTRQYSVAGWQMQHDDVWVLARAFAESPALLGLKLPIDLWRVGWSQQAHLFESASWISAVLWGNERRQRIRISLFLQEDVSLNSFRNFAIIAGVEQTARFGMELEQEIIAASPNWAAERSFTSAPK